jgi:hypothetical protein
MQVHLGTGRTHTLHTLGLGMGHLGTSGAGLAHLLSEAKARETGDDCAVEVVVASTDHVDWVSVAASLHLAEEGRLAEGVHLVVLSACLDLTECGGAAEGDHLLVLSARPVQVGLGGAVYHAELLGSIAGVLQAWSLQRTELRLSVEHQLGGALVIPITFQTVPSMVALVTCAPCPGRCHTVLAADVHGAVCLLPVSPGLLLQALLPLTCCSEGELAYSAGHGKDAGQPPVDGRAGDNLAL